MVVTLYPTSDALITNANYVATTPTSPTTKFDKVDESIADESTTYVGSNTSNVCGVDFGMQDLSGWTEPIAKVTVFMRIGVIGSGKTYYFKPRVNRVNFASYTSKAGGGAGAAGYENFTWDYPLNPSTGLPWTVEAVNAMEAGFSWYGTDTKAYGYLTQLNVIVTPVSPMTRIQGIIAQGVIIS